MIALTEKKCKVGNIGSIVDLENILSRDTCVMKETLSLVRNEVLQLCLDEVLFANLFHLRVHSVMFYNKTKTNAKSGSDIERIERIHSYLMCCKCFNLGS